MEKQIGIIGTGATKELVMKVLEDKGIKDVIIFSSGEPLPDEIVLPKSSGIEARPELLTPFVPKMIYEDSYVDGKTSRRERRKRERRLKR